jgi:hypothetical protein
MALKQQKQQGAMQQLTMAIDMAQKTGIGDPAAIEKLMKEAGLDVTTGLPDTKGKGPARLPTQQASAPLPGGVTPQAISSLGNSMGGPNGGVQAAVPTVSGQGGTPGQTKSPTAGSQIEQFVAQARAHTQLMAQSEQDRMTLESTINHLTTQALGGDQQAVGRLQRIGKVPFNAEQELWTDPVHGPEVRQAAYDRALGHEMPEEKRQRETKWAEAMFTSGAFDTPADALKYIQGASGAPKPKVNLARLVDETKLANELVQAGVPPDKVKEVAQAMAAGTSLADALPAGIRPVIIQQMEDQRLHNRAMEAEAKAQTGLQAQQLGMESQRLGMEQTRLQSELEQYKIAAIRAQQELEKADNADLNNQLDFLVSATDKGVDVPDTLREQIISKLASHMNAHVEKEPVGFWENMFNYVLPKSYEYGRLNVVPNKADISEFTGKTQAGAPPTSTPPGMEGSLDKTGQFLTGPGGTGILGSVVEGLSGGKASEAISKLGKAIGKSTKEPKQFDPLHALDPKRLLPNQERLKKAGTILKGDIESVSKFVSTVGVTGYKVRDAKGVEHHFKTKAEADAFYKSITSGK